MLTRAPIGFGAEGVVAGHLVDGPVSHHLPERFLTSAPDADTSHPGVAIALEHQAVDPAGQGRPWVAGPDPPGHRAGGAVGEEDAQPGQHAQHVRRQPQRGKLLGAQVADDRRVGQQQQRLGDQGGEGRQGEREDPAVQGAGADQGRGGVVHRSCPQWGRITPV